MVVFRIMGLALCVFSPKGLKFGFALCVVPLAMFNLNCRVQVGSSRALGPLEIVSEPQGDIVRDRSISLSLSLSLYLENAKKGGAQKSREQNLTRRPPHSKKFPTPHFGMSCPVLS